MGGMYETMTPGEFWLINTAICAGGALAVLVLRPVYRRLLALDGEEAWRGAAVHHRSAWAAALRSAVRAPSSGAALHRWVQWS